MGTVDTSLKRRDSLSSIARREASLAVTAFTEFLWAMWLIFIRCIGLSFIKVSDFGANIYNLKFNPRRKSTLASILFTIVGCLFAFIIWLIFQSVLMLGSTLVGTLGLRTGDYRLKEQIIAWLPFILVLLILPMVLQEYRLLQLTQVLIFSVIVLGLNILTGFSGQISLGHAGFALVGSYSAAYVMSAHNAPMGIGILAGGVTSALTGLIFGLPAVRIKGPYLALVTLGLAMSIPKVLKSVYLEPYTNGLSGLSIDQPSPPEWLAAYLNSTQWQYLIVLLISGILIVGAHSLLWRSRYGRALITLSQGEEKALALGINVPRYKLLAFVLSSFYAGMGGVMMLMIVGYANPESFNFFDSIDYLVAIGIGGLTSILGSVIGGIFLAYQSDLTGIFAKLLPHGEELRWTFYGLTLMSFMILLPRGIAGELRRIIYLLFFEIPIRRKSILDPPPDYDFPYKDRLKPAK
jgi:branched-chain amino acid transport system permease protein